MKKLRIMVLLGSSRPSFSNQYISPCASTVSRSCAEAGIKGESCCRSLPPSILQRSCLCRHVSSWSRELIKPSVTHFCQVRLQPSQCLHGLPCANQCQRRRQVRAHGHKGEQRGRGWPCLSCEGSLRESAAVPPPAFHRFYPGVGCREQGVAVGVTNLSFLQASVLRLPIAVQTEVELRARFSVFSVVCLSISPAECSVWKQSTELPVWRVVTARASAGAVHPMPAANASARWEASHRCESGPVTQEEQEAGSGSTNSCVSAVFFGPSSFPSEVFRYFQ